MTAASIRYKNPGAMWGRTGPRPSADREVATNSPLARKWGSATTFYLSDGMGQGNNIAVFPDYVSGICAQLDLWRTSKNYRNKRFADAIAIWSGHNSVPQYIAFCKARVPGLTEDTIMDDNFWASPMGVAFLKAQAGHEAGVPYPAPAADWIEAQRLVMGGIVPQIVVPKEPLPPSMQPPKPTKVGKKVAQAGAAIGGTLVTGTVASQAISGGFEPWMVLMMIAGGIALTVLIVTAIKRSEK